MRVSGIDGPFTRWSISDWFDTDYFVFRVEDAEEEPTGEDSQQPHENGDSTVSVAVPASGNLYIDGLLSGFRWLGWAGTGEIWYSDPDSVADYGAYGNPAALVGFGQVSAQQMVAVQFGLDAGVVAQLPGAGGFSVEGFTNLGVNYNGSGSGFASIRVANSSGPSTAYAYYPDNLSTGGDAFFGGSGRFPNAGDYDWHTVLHELGHSLGLKHGHEFGGPAGTALPFQFDSVEFSIMTYRTFVGDDTGGYNYGATSAPQTFMMFDIYALQYMYGIDYTTNSGDTVYKWTPASGDTYINGQLAIDAYDRIFLTIWDGGGVDTYDLTAYTTNLNINLIETNWSNFGTQLADLGGGPNGGYARGNVFNPFWWGDTRPMIEQVLAGSGNDRIEGNAANNYFVGNAGADQLFGGNGKDKLFGGNGNDKLFGSNGNDRLTGGTGLDKLTGGAGVDVFDFNAITESGLSATTQDVIADFVHLTDDIDLSTIDASSIVANNNAFAFIGTAAFSTTTAGQVRFQQFNNAGTANDYTMVYGDTDSDVGAEFAIKLTGLIALTSADFVL